jgi:prepilin-type processing-associated H-X9-DG protein
MFNTYIFYSIVCALVTIILLPFVKEAARWRGASKRDDRRFWVRLSAAAGFAMASIIFFSIETRGDELVHQGLACHDNMLTLGVAIAEYTISNDGRLPLASAWQDEISNPRYLNFNSMSPGSPVRDVKELFHCPSVVRYGYALNNNVAGMSMSDIRDPADTVLLFETSRLVRNASGTQSDLAPERHVFYNFCFCDGHVRSVNRTGLRQLKWTAR